MFDQVLASIPAHDARLFELLCALFSTLSLFFAFFRGTVWLSKLFGTVTPADLGRAWRYALKALELLQLWRASQKAKAVRDVMSVLIALGVIVGCAGTFEEATGKFAALTPRKAPDPVLCQQISSRAKWEKAGAAALELLAGGSGVATWPIKSDSGQVGLAISAGVLAAGGVFVLVLYEQDASEYIAAGCAAPKESVK